MQRATAELRWDIWADRCEDAPQIVEFASGQLAAFSRRCPDRDTANQDTIGIFPIDASRGVIAVADGCGGMSQGDVASLRAIQALGHGLEKTDEAGLRAAILDGIEHANRAVQTVGNGAATTLICAEIDHEFMRPYNVGDSQLVVVSNRGRVKYETGAHSPVGYAVQGGFLSEEEAIHHEDRHLVSNVLGSPDGHIEIGARRPLAVFDTLVIASDGLFDNLRVPEIAEIVRKGPLAQAAQLLAVQAQERMRVIDADHPSKPDDLTFVIFRRRRQDSSPNQTSPNQTG